jgi:hypothetical protein
MDPCEAREIINEDYIMTMFPFRNEGRRVTYIRFNELKRPSEHCLTSGMLELYLLAKSTTHIREGGITRNLLKNTTND